MKWVTLFWPLPFRIDDLKFDTSSKNNHIEFPHFALPNRLGDLADLESAYGCLFWSSVIFASFIFVHLCVIIKFKFCHRRSTFPHHLSFGNWESRCLHWLSFPVSVASGLILGHSQAILPMKIVAFSILSAVLMWISIIAVNLSRTICKGKRVIWMWQNSMREDGQLEDHVSGCWTDVWCDQLLTQPVNRSLCKWVFPWRWVSTVADVHPVRIAHTQRAFQRQQQYQQQEQQQRYQKRQQQQNNRNFGVKFEDDDEAEEELQNNSEYKFFDKSFLRQMLFGPNQYQISHKPTMYPLGKNAQLVDVYRTVKPNKICPGQRLITGLMRTQWLDLLFTYEGLTVYHSNLVADTGKFSDVPLTVKACQLTVRRRWKSG